MLKIQVPVQWQSNGGEPRIVAFFWWYTPLPNYCLPIAVLSVSD
jgi:hypothetical protein